MELRENFHASKIAGTRATNRSLKNFFKEKYWKVLLMNFI
jgi:hypothetical protein